MEDNYKKLDDGTLWPNPKSKSYRDMAWRLRYSQDTLDKDDFYFLASVVDAYENLVLHPAFILKEVAKKISSLRRAIK